MGDPLTALVNEAELLVNPIFEQSDWAEEAITAAQGRHYGMADLLYHCFPLLVPTAPLMSTEFVYRSHCRELLERVVAGGDPREATDAEVAIACERISEIVAFGSAAVALYMRTWARAFPDQPAFEALDLESYEHVAGWRVDELEADTRRRLRQPERLPETTCAGRHYGQDRPDCPLVTPRRGTPMTITTACTSPLDEPTSELNNRGQRFFWPLRRALGDPYDGWAGIQLSCHHSTDRKEFWTSLHPLTVFDNGGYSATVSLMAAPAWRKAQPVARYSAKAMAAFAEAALAGLRQAYTNGDEGVRALFEVTP